MEISKGMYIRTKKGKTGKIIKQIDNSGSLHHNNYVWLLDNGDMLALRSNKVKSASFNLIDLIEVGDYVNGYKVIDVIDFDIYGKKITDREIVIDKLGYTAYRRTILSDDVIENIVTKEQFDSMKYVVERDK